MSTPNALAGLKPYWNFRTYNLPGDAAHQLAVNTGNGNLVVTATDFVFAARIPALLMRTYNSSRAGETGLLGQGWRLAWEEYMSDYGAGAINITYTDPTGTDYVFIHTATNTWTTPQGIFSELTYDSGTSRLFLTAPDGFRREFEVGHGKLRAYQDANENRLEFDYSAGKPSLITALAGAASAVLVDTFDYNGDGYLEHCGLDQSGDDGESVLFDFFYDSGDQLLSVTDPEGQVWEYEYAGAGLPLNFIRDPRGVVADPTYGTAIHYTDGQVDSITDAATHTIEFAYDGLETTITDRRENDTVVTHATGDLNPLTIVLPGLTTPHDTVTLTWDGDLNLTAVEDPNGNTTAYEYDSAGNVTLITDALTGETSYTYDATYHCLTQVETPEQCIVELQYDDAATRSPTQLIRHPDYGPTPAIDFITYFDYDTTGDLLRVTDPAGQVVEYTYEAAYGVCLTASRFAGSVDGLREALTTTYAYPAEGAPLWLDSVTNPEGLVVEYVRDGLGRVTTERQLYKGDPGHDPIAYGYGYDECANVTTVTDPESHATLYMYNKLNLLETVKLPLTDTDATYRYDYDPEENLATYTQFLPDTPDPISIETTYTYTALNQLESITQPAVDFYIDGDPVSFHPVYRFYYDPAGNLVRRLEPVSAVLVDDDPVYTYSETVCAYDALNRLATETGPVYVEGEDPPTPPAGTQRLTYGYDADSRLTSLTGDQVDGAEERTYAYAYDGCNRLVSVTDPGPGDPGSPGTTTYEYYANDQLYRVRLPRQNQSPVGPYSRTYAYDGAGRLTAVTDALGYSQTYSYLKDGRLASATDPAGSVTAYSYDGFGRALRLDYGQGSFKAYAYATSGDRLQTVSGPDGFLTGYAFDDRGRLLGCKRYIATGGSPVYLQTNYSYDQLSRLTAQSDLARDRRDEYAYDALGRLSQAVVDADHDAVEGHNYTFDFRYDLAGRLTGRTNPAEGADDDGPRGELAYVYDAAGRLTSSTDPLGYVTTLDYDAWGQLEKRTYPDGSFEAYSYDKLGRLAEQSNALGETYAFAYDANGNNVRQDTPYGLATWFTYNEREELVATISNTDPPGPDGSGALVELFHYTPAGQLDSYSGPQQEQWCFTYDSLGRWTEARNSLGRSTLREYTANNCLAATTDFDGRQFLLAYDALNRRLSTTGPDSLELVPVTLYAWDDNNGADLSSVVEPGGRTTAFTHDRLGRLTSTSVTEGGSFAASLEEEDPPPPLVTEYTYNWRSQVAAHTLPAYIPDFTVSGQFDYDTRGSLTGTTYSDTGSTVGMTYDACGRTQTMTFPGGLSRSFSYNQAGRMVADSISDLRGQQLQTFYGYDKAGHRVSQSRDRSFPPGVDPPGVLPIWIPIDLNGNPGIPTTSPTTVDGTQVFPATPVDGNPDATSGYTLEWSVDSGTETLIFKHGATEQSRATLSIADDISTITATYPQFDAPVSFQLPGVQTLLPQWLASMSEPLTERRQRDPQFNLTAVTTDRISPTVSIPAVAVADTRDCCKETLTGPSDIPLLDTEHGRGGVQHGLGLSATLAGGQQGSIPALPTPWGGMASGTGLQNVKVTQPWEPVDNATPADGQRHYVGAGEDDDVQTYYDPLTGQLVTVYDKHQPAPDYLMGQWEYDAFGRTTHSTDNSGETAVGYGHKHDWLSGELEFLQPDDPGEGPGGYGINHGPGLSRITDGMGLESWLLRGPQGQVRAQASGADGVPGTSEDPVGLTSNYGYNAWGGRGWQLSLGGDWPPHTEPIYLDGDQQLLPGSPSPESGPSLSLPSMKQGPGVTTDTTPLVGTLTGPSMSGAAGQGASGSPDTPPGVGSTQFAPGSPWDSGFGPQIDLDPGFAPHWQHHTGGDLPGLPTDKSPTGAPPSVAQDTAGIADQRLRDLWKRQSLSGSSVYYGAKPGKQTGSFSWDDMRNSREPLPAQPGAGIDPFLFGPPNSGNPAYDAYMREVYAHSSYNNYLPNADPRVPNPHAEAHGKIAGVAEQAITPGTHATDGKGGGHDIGRHVYVNLMIDGDPNQQVGQKDGLDFLQRQYELAVEEYGKKSTLAIDILMRIDRAKSEAQTRGTAGDRAGAVAQELFTNVLLMGLPALAEARLGVEAVYGGIRETGLVLGKGLLNDLKGVWNLGLKERGLRIEKALGGNLPAGFPTIDKWDDAKGVATSIKSVDLSHRYPRGKGLRDVVIKYADDLANFSYGRRSGVEITEEMIKGKVLHLAIPPEASLKQLQELNKAIRYAKKLGLKTDLTVIP